MLESTWGVDQAQTYPGLVQAQMSQAQMRLGLGQDQMGLGLAQARGSNLALGPTPSLSLGY